MDILAGQLFVYHEDRRLVAFRTGPAACRRYIIYVGGMAGSAGTSAPLGAPYIRALSTAANDADWCLVQPMLSSAGPGLGITDGWQYVHTYCACDKERPKRMSLCRRETCVWKRAAISCKVPIPLPLLPR